MSILEVNQVYKYFGGVKANEDISLSVEQGSIVGLIGPNGSGKTTLFNSIVGTHPIDKGSIKFDDKEVSELPVPVVAKLGLLRTFQQTRIYGKLNCIENMLISNKSQEKGLLSVFSKIPPELTDKAENLLKNKNPRLITVSRLDKRKNHEKIIMALRNLKQIYPNIIYTCIGYGEEENNIKSLVKELNLEDQFLFLKDVSQDTKNALISKSNLFVMPSIIYKKSVEGFGIAFAEAGQYGIPSIGGKDGGAADAIVDGKSGKICDGNNLDEIYSNINELLKNNLYIEYGKYAKLYVKKFEWKNIIEQYKQIL